MTISAPAPLRSVVLLTAVAVALLLLLSGLVPPTADAAATDESRVVATVQHEVKAGDTLWSIAMGFTPPGEDVRATIHEIKSTNQLDSSTIGVGDVLVIPVEF